MSILTRLKELLDSSGVPYQHHTHPRHYTAAGTARAMHVSGKEMAKSVIVNTDGFLRIAVLPSDYRLDLKHLRFMTRSENLRLAREAEFKDVFPACEVGAMPPFGNAYGLPVFCDTMLQGNEFIEFNAGTHTDTVRMAFSDFKRLANPTMLDLVDYHPSAA